MSEEKVPFKFPFTVGEIKAQNGFVEYKDACEEAIQQEREACAKVAEEWITDSNRVMLEKDMGIEVYVPYRIAKAIRDRK